MRSQVTVEETERVAVERQADGHGSFVALRHTGGEKRSSDWEKSMLGTLNIYGHHRFFYHYYSSAVLKIRRLNIYFCFWDSSLNSRENDSCFLSASKRDVFFANIECHNCNKLPST